MKIKNVICGIFAIIILPVIILYFNTIQTHLFSPDGKNLASFIKLLGAVIGMITVIWGIKINNDRVNQIAKQVEKQNEITERGQINTRFKDAALLLAEDNTSANLSGAFALHQIAKDASLKVDKEGYVEIIHEILCAYVSENRDNENRLLTSRIILNNLLPETNSIYTLLQLI